MLVISSREFRDKQKNYLDKVDEGEELLIQRGKDKSYKIVAVSDDDTLLSKKDFLAKIDKALYEIKSGKGVKIQGKGELMAYLDSL